MKHEQTEKAYAEYFQNFDKVKAFDEIASLFFDKNFGTVSKSDMELLMFRFYMEAMIETNKIGDSDVISYAACSDYKMSQKLGITQQRVRNLKVKKELIYPQKDFHWEQSLAYLLQEKNKVEFHNGIIRVNIPDPNLFDAIQDFVEDHGGYVDLHYNRKILEIKEEYLLQLAIMLEQKENQEKILDYINKELKREKLGKSVHNASAVMKSILEIGVNVSEILSNVTGMISPNNQLGNALHSLHA
ncbi:MAG: hypothetical protein LIO74_05290 [Ruminococcus sp.]|nr:hypothetical protein [Ruminococcus sp.]